MSNGNGITIRQLTGSDLWSRLERVVLIKSIVKKLNEKSRSGDFKNNAFEVLLRAGAKPFPRLRFWNKQRFVKFLEESNTRILEKTYNAAMTVDNERVSV